MKLIFDLNKSAMTGKVQVQRTVTRGGTTFQQHFWVNPSDVRDTDVVIGQPKEELKVGQKVTYNGKRYKIDSIKGNKVTMTCRSTDMYSVDDPRYKNGDETRTVDKSELTSKGKTLDRHGKPVTDALSPANIQPKAPKGFSDKVTSKPSPKTTDKPVNIDDFQFTNYKNPDGQNTTNRKTYKDAMKDWSAETERLFERAIKNYSGDTPPAKQLEIAFMNLNREASIRDMVSNSSESGLKAARGAIYARQARLMEDAKEYTKWDRAKGEWVKESSDKPDKAPDKAVGKTWSETKTELGKMGYKVDSIFSSNPPQPKEKLTLYKDGKEYEAEVTKYSNGDYEILGSSIKEVKNDDKTDDKSPVVTNFKNGFVRYTPDGEKPSYHGGKVYKYFASRKGDAKGKYFDTKEEAEDYVNGNSNTKVRKVSNMSDLENGIRSVNRAIGKEHNIFNSVSVMGGGRLGEQLAMVHIPKLQTESNARKVIDEQLKREFGNSVKYSLTKQSEHFILSMTLDDNKTPSASTVKDTSQPKSDDKPTSTSGKFDASEFTKLKSDRPKALQYLKDKGITWKETDNEGVNWMRACMSASKASNSDASVTKKDSSGKSSTDSKLASKESKKSIIDLLSANGNDRIKTMQAAKDMGITWKESDNAGINWMRASLAMQKHYESGNTVQASTDAKKDDIKSDNKTQSKKSGQKATISDLKKPTSNGTSTTLSSGDYKITVTKHRNVGTNAKQHPSLYHISVDKGGDNVFRTDKTDWKDIKYHAQRYIDADSNS